MKKILITLCVLLFAFLLYSDYKEEKELAAARAAEARKEVWLEGYNDGYEDGYEDAVSDAPRIVGSAFLSEIDDIADDVQAVCGMDTGKAYGIIMNYLDGEPTDAGDLEDALWVVWEYDRAVYDVIHEVFG